MSDTTKRAPTITMEELLGQGVRPAQGARPLVRRAGHSGPIAPEAQMPEINVGLKTLQSFELTQRVALAFANSTLVPREYRSMVPKRRNRDEMEENPAAIANCVIAINIAFRLDVDPLMVMQNLDVIEGRPSWRAQFVTATINNSRRYVGGLRYRETKGDVITVIYRDWKWGERTGEKIWNDVEIKVRNDTCVAYTTDAVTGQTIDGPEVSMELAVKEGWYTKEGSKWQTTPQIMLRYRSASWFGRSYAPDLLMGFPMDDETREIIQAEKDEDGQWVFEEELRRRSAEAVVAAAASADAREAAEAATRRQAEEAEAAEAAAKAAADAEAKAAAFAEAKAAAAARTAAAAEAKSNKSPTKERPAAGKDKPSAATEPAPEPSAEEPGVSLPLRGGGVRRDTRPAPAEPAPPLLEDEKNSMRAILEPDPRFTVAGISVGSTMWHAFLDHTSKLHAFTDLGEAKEEARRIQGDNDFPGDR